MLRFITQKFRNQSLNEVRPIENQGNSWLFEDVEELETNGGEKGKDKPSLNERDYGNGWNNNYSANGSEESASIDAQLRELTLKNFPENSIYCPVPSRVDLTSEVDLKDSNRNETRRDDSKENHPCFVPIGKLPSLDKPASCRRKFPDVKRRKADISSSESSSSDDEIKELCSYGVIKFRASSRPPDKMAAVSSSFVNCQRRRSKIASSRFQSVQRPSINFDRMQQTLLKRQRNKIVRVRTLSSTRNCDVSSLGFKPITNLNPCINHLAPVENPIAF